MEGRASLSAASKQVPDEPQPISSSGAINERSQRETN